MKLRQKKFKYLFMHVKKFKNSRKTFKNLKDDRRTG